MVKAGGGRIALFWRPGRNPGGKLCFDPGIVPAGILQSQHGGVCPRLAASTGPITFINKRDFEFSF